MLDRSEKIPRQIYKHASGALDLVIEATDFKGPGSVKIHMMTELGPSMTMILSREERLKLATALLNYIVERPTRAK